MILDRTVQNHRPAHIGMIYLWSEFDCGIFSRLFDLIFMVYSGFLPIESVYYNVNPFGWW